MFGYITADPALLTEQQRERYTACYCGLCRSLSRRHGLLGRMTLTYDMTFLVLVLSSLYEPEETCTAGRCPMHPVKKRNYLQTRYTDYAADLNVLLAWWNCMDDWEDEHRLDRRLLAALLRRRAKRVEADYPRQSAAIHDGLKSLHRYEAGPEANADRATEAFAALMGELFVSDPADHWSASLRRLGQGLGRFIYLTDACIDYEKDLKKGRPNPLTQTDGTRTPQGDYDLLSLMLSDAANAFEYMPLCQDVDLMRNILYSGVWLKYRQAMLPHENSNRRRTIARLAAFFKGRRSNNCNNCNNCGNHDNCDVNDHPNRKQP